MYFKMQDELNSFLNLSFGKSSGKCQVINLIF